MSGDLNMGGNNITNAGTAAGRLALYTLLKCMP